ncbi:hypothetical protein Tco_0744599 [Tanacetum coccineum]
MGKEREELIRENVFGLGGHRDHLPACLAHMLYCVVAEEQYNLAYFFVKRIQCARYTPTANLPYGMFLTRLYRHVMETYPHLDNGIYDIVDRVMRPLALNKLDDLEVIVARHVIPYLLHLFIIKARYLINTMMIMMMIMSKLLVQVLHHLPPTLTLLILSTTKTTKCLPLPNKPMKLSLNDKPYCSIKRNKLRFQIIWKGTKRSV